MKTSCEDQVARLLSADAAERERWEVNVFDELTGSKRLVICGAGGLGRKVISGLRKVGVEPQALVDNNPTRWGGTVERLTVLSPADAASKFGEDCAFVVAIWGAHSLDRLAQRKQQWTERGCRTVVSFRSLFWKYPSVFLPHYACDVPHKVFAEAARIQTVAGVWSDEFSCKEFVEQLRWRTELDYEGLPEPVLGPTYFPSDIVSLRADERLVDCGAFDGDTIRDFVRVSGGSFSKVWALEPDPGNFEKLTVTISSLPAELRARFELLQIGAGRRTEKVRFTGDATAASTVSEQGGIEVQCDALDTLLSREEPSFIKMDIEGAEPAAVLGAARLLNRCRPILALSVYHLQEHLWEIPELLRGMLQDYHFYLRPHDREGWDLVCYAVPAERALN